MKLIINDKEKRIYQDDNKIYTLINMGAYVGYKTRDLFKETKDFWKLISYEDKSNKNGKLCIDTIINDEGHYVRIKMDKGEVSRYICLLDENIVISDNLHDKQTNRDVLSTNDLYSAFGKDIYNKNMDLLSDYLKQEPTFYSNEGEVFERDFPNNQELTDFLSVNEKLTLASNNKIKTRKLFDKNKI